MATESTTEEYTIGGRDRWQEQEADGRSRRQEQIAGGVGTLSKR